MKRQLKAIWSKLLIPVIVAASIVGKLSIYLFTTTRCKRSVYAASLYAHIKGIEVRQMERRELEEYLFKIIRLLEIPSIDERSMLLPMVYHKHIWKKLDLSNRCVIEPSDADSYVDSIIQSSPFWIKYSSCKMHNDTVLVLNEVLGCSIPLPYRERLHGHLAMR